MTYRYNPLSGALDDVGSAGVSPIPVADGGTGATDAATARTNIGLDTVNSFPAFTPHLLLNFAMANGVLDSRIAFSRASTATYFDRDGLLKTAAANVPRFSFDPYTGQSLGLLIEQSSTNICLRSEDLANSYWVVTRSSISANAAAAPDGTTTADKLVEDTSSNTTHFMYAASVVSFTAGAAYAISFFAKAAGRNYLQFSTNSTNSVFSTTENAKFDLATGIVISNTNCSASIQALVNGWYRCSVVLTTVGTGNGRFSLTLMSTSSTTSYTGDGGSGVYLWGLQVEAGTGHTSYIPTTTATVTRSADAASLSGSDFPSIFNAVEGTFVLASYRRATTASSAALDVSDGTANERLRIGIDATPNRIVQVVDGGVEQVNLTLLSGAGTANTLYKTAFAYKSNDFAACMNGGTVQTDSSGSLPTVNQLTLGALATGTEFLNGNLLALMYWPKRLTNAELQGITA